MMVLKTLIVEFQESFKTWAADRATKMLELHSMYQ